MSKKLDRMKSQKAQAESTRRKCWSTAYQN